MTETSDNSIVVEGISKSFGDVQALQEVSLTAPSGKVFGLLGPNGAGKTTLVRVLTTLLRPDAGRATVAGLDVTDNRPELREIIGLAGQYAAVDENLTGQENLAMVGRLYHLGWGKARKRARALLDQFGLENAADRVVKTYSGGMRRRLDLAASLVARPRVLFLDEPTTGLDPRSRIDLWNLIRELVQGGTTLMLTTQYLEEVDELADRIAVIDEGRIIAQGTSEELKSQVAADVIEVKLANREQLQPAVEAVQRFGTQAPQTEEGTGLLTMPVADGAQSLIQVVRRLDEANIELVDLRLRRPSLDDVFLNLTGGTARQAEPATPGALTSSPDGRDSGQKGQN